MNTIHKTTRRHKHKRKLFTARSISAFTFLLALSAFTAFIISNPLANFYTVTYTLLIYLLTICGSLLIIFIVFFGFTVKSIGSWEKHFKNADDYYFFLKEHV